MKKIECHCRYGSYKLPRAKQPDKDLFHLRIKALLLNDEFNDFCSCSDISNMERDVLSAWGNFPTWVAKHRDEHCLIALLFYGNIFKNSIESTWTRFKTASENLYEVYRPIPFQEVPAGVSAPPHARTVSFDPGLKHKDLKRLFQGFLSLMKQSDHIKPALSGYYELLPKAKLNEIARYIEAVTFANSKKSRRVPWMKMEKLYKAYSGSSDSRRKIIYRDVQKGKNLSYWALRGLFPKITNRSK